MAYFPNGTSGLDYQEHFCVKCVNYRDKKDGRGYGCPIFDLHLLWNYDAIKDKDKKMALEMLIPTTDVGNDQCSMFVEKQ